MGVIVSLARPGYSDVVHRSFFGEDGERLNREFEEMERREMGERTFERFAAMVEALEAKHGGSGLPAKDEGRTT